MIAAQMPVRATTRGEARTRLERDCDVLVCGASFAGLAIARELAGSGARVLMIDRYEIGERQTSACAMPTRWLNAMELQASHRQTFDEIVVHSPFHTSRWSLPWSFSTFDYRELCALLWEQADDGELEFQTATITGREGNTVQTDRGPLTAPLIVDGLGWRRVLSNGTKIQPPNAPMSRGLEVHPRGSGEEMELWIDPRYIRSGYSWSFPAEDELRVGVGSFRPADHVKQPTVKLAGDLGLPAESYQGNWIPHKLRAAVEDGVFFVGDSAGHCLPLTAEGIRTALYFGLACGRELRAVVEGRITRERALKRYGDFSAAHAKKFAWMLRAQQAAGFTTPSRSLATVIRCFENRRLCGWVFDRYLDIAPPAFVADGARALTRSRLAAVSA
jgi:digeranylgeranylglycerophospholipid reductase